MSEQKNNTEGMNFGTGSTLEELFGATIPHVDLGGQFPAPAQAVQPQAMPVTNPPAAAPEGQPAQPEQVQQPANPQAAPSPAPQPVQQPTAQPQTSGTQTAPAAQPTGQVVDLFGAVVEDGADALLAKLAGKRPVFEYGSITDEIEDPNLTFEQLRVKMSADCPELEARSHVSWTMSYAGITERVSSADAGIYETKAKIEKSKKFKEALKKMKPKDKEPVCTVKPTVTAQKKGVLQFPRYKGLFGSTEQAEQSDKAIAYIPAQDGRVYEMRRNEIGTFTAPSMHIAELEDIRAGFQMSLPRLPAALLTQIIAFFRRVCVDYGRDVEALVNVLWDREKGGYVLHVPPQRITRPVWRRTSLHSRTRRDTCTSWTCTRITRWPPAFRGRMIWTNRQRACTWSSGGWTGITRTSAAALRAAGVMWRYRRNRSVSARTSLSPLSGWKTFRRPG